MNYEVLTVFFDKLVSLYLDSSKSLLKKNELLRLKLLSQSFSLLEKDNLSAIQQLNISMSIMSLLKAENLFDIYLSSTNNDKINLIDDIQNIIDGNIYLEQMLEKNNVTFENSQDFKLLTKHI